MDGYTASQQGLLLMGPVTEGRRNASPADRLAQYERDLHDDIGKDRSQDTDWLRAGFLQRGAEIERLEDGIRAIVQKKWAQAQEQHEAGFDWAASELQRECEELSALLDGE